ncbi:uncharacterized protein PgNI_02519 [Pyricularia grisea]|uniref:ER-bound oxygenase mpaB/mpaB'/Rubber oxygenase catalytic domain-containing protein n=1 Tax=Pyricularia grisea TaxID=148305 RepID=A0A6P8BG84_PYRGI|nr:uncharacterized protein PgNI_02519 [Pyricularia grisea]TLD15667.1 hypothetical protein PgNI_02519 [Pyricularia grisea]
MEAALANLSNVAQSALQAAAARARGTASVKPGDAATASYNQWLPYVAAVVVAYPILVHLLRYRSLHALRRRFPYGPEAGKNHKPYSAMTNNEAAAIINRLSDWEFPTMILLGLQMALLRTYGIPSISRLLAATRQLGQGDTVGRRYADTSVIMNEIYENPPDTPRSAEAYARLNYLHGVYIKAGKISNDDMLYVLSLFMYDAVDAVNLYEWRRITELERCAFGVFHHGMGTAMEIDFSPLPSAAAGFRDGLHFYDELYAWSKAYERSVMLPAQSNHDVAVHTVNLIQRDFPSLLHPVVEKMVYSVFNDQFLAACKFPKPARSYYLLTRGLFALKRYACRHLLLPRMAPDAPWRSSDPAEDVGPDGKRCFKANAGLPVYVRPTFWNRWGPGALYFRLIGKPVPGDKGMEPDGYLLKDAGPKQHSGKGWDEAELTAKKLLRTSRGGCPFA